MRFIAPMLLTWWVLPTSFPPGVWRRTLPRWRRIRLRLGLPGLGRFRFFLGPSSLLTPLWYLHSIVRFEGLVCPPCLCASMWWTWHLSRSEEHTSELQSRGHLVCRLLLEKKKNQQ